MSAAFRGQREEVEQMKNCLRVLSQPTPTSASEAELAADQQEREGALELLADLCENMDNAAGIPGPPQPAPQLPGPCRFCRLSPFCLLPPPLPSVLLQLSPYLLSRGPHRWPPPQASAPTSRVWL